MIEAKLIVVGGETKTKQVDLRLPTIIGRGHEVNLTLPHPLVSRRHCEIYERDGYLVVKDLGSLNGTFVNNKKIDGEEILEPEQLLTLGTVTFRANYEIGSIAQSASGAETESNSQTVLHDQDTANSSSAIEFEASQHDNGLPAAELKDKDTVYDDEKNASDTDEIGSVIEVIDAVLRPAISESPQTVVDENSSSGSEPVSSSGLKSLDRAATVQAPEKVQFAADTIPQQDDADLDSFLRKMPR